MELLVAVVLASVIGAAVLSLVRQQGSFYGANREYVFAEQSLRAAAELAGSELAMAGPGDLVAATAESVTVRFDLYRAVVCHDVQGLDAAYVFIYDSVTNANLPQGTRGYAASPPYASGYTYVDGWSPLLTLGAKAKSECVARGAPDLPESWRYRTMEGWALTGFGAPPERGSVLRKYGMLTYRFASSNLGSGDALWRNRQELVSPFDTSAAFRYVMAGGDTVATPSDLAKVSAVRIEATALGEGDPRHEARRPLAFDIWLRNER